MTDQQDFAMSTTFEATKRKIETYFAKVKDDENFTELIRAKFEQDFKDFNAQFHEVIDMYATKKNGVIVLSDYGDMYHQLINYQDVLHQEHLKG